MSRDVFRTFRFTIEFDGVTVAGFTRVSGLRRSQDVIEHRAGDSETEGTEKLEGLLKYGTVTFERGMSSDQEFLDWAQQMADRVTASADCKKEVTVNVKNKIGEVEKSYALHLAWVSDLEVTDLDSTASGIVYERMTIEIESFDIHNKDRTIKNL